MSWSTLRRMNCGLGRANAEEHSSSFKSVCTKVCLKLSVAPPGWPLAIETCSKPKFWEVSQYAWPSDTRQLIYLPNPLKQTTWKDKKKNIPSTDKTCWWVVIASLNFYLFPWTLAACRYETLDNFETKSERSWVIGDFASLMYRNSLSSLSAPCFVHGHYSMLAEIVTQLLHTYIHTYIHIRIYR